MELMADLSTTDVRRIVDAVKEGKPVPDGPIISTFSPEAIAQALEQEVMRARALPNPKISMHMGVEDALLLAKFLRFRSF